MAGAWHELENRCVQTDVIEATSFDMAALSGNTYYRIELRAHNAIGFSSPASIVMKTTRGESDSANNNLGTLLYSASIKSAASSKHKKYSYMLTNKTTKTTTTTVITVITAITTTTCITLFSILASMLV